METKEEKSLEFYDRYSRQYYVLGARAMNELEQANVLIYGAGGLGLEIAKCVALAGVKLVCLQDKENMTLADLSTHYYGLDSIGKNRAIASRDYISELNPYVIVKALVEDLDISTDLEYLKTFSCVVLTQCPLAVQLRVNKFCRENHIKFISVESRGVFCWAFVDFGLNFQVFDKDGEFPKELVFVDISKEKDCIISCSERHNFEEGDIISFAEVEGNSKLVNTFHTILKSEPGLLPEQFRIGLDTSEFKEVITGRIVEVKKVQSFNYKSLEESLKEPKFLPTDFFKEHLIPQLHLGMKTLHRFSQTYGQLPRSWNKEDSQSFLNLAQKINEEDNTKITLECPLLELLSFTARGELISLTGTIAGHVAQEVIKGVTGKFTPLDQWLYFDASEVAGTDPEDHKPQGNRYDSQVICIGKTISDKIQNTKLFMVGSGAIGCEMLKLYAMLGVATQPDGKIIVTDNDVIEKSNLNRQFLFRDKDINSPKSTTAAKAILKFNPLVNIEAFIDKACPETEDKYTNQFISSVDLCVNALDNITARRYMDSRIVLNERPLLESGTMGPKGHIQVIIPHRTECYTDVQDERETTEYAVCTIKTFPEKIEHTIEWARGKFQTLFVSKPKDLERFIQNPKLFIEKLAMSQIPVSHLLYIKKFLVNPFVDFTQCLAFSRKKFQNYFNYSMQQLLSDFPKDKVIDGKPFWKLPRRAPMIITFDANDPLHYSFVWHTALIYAYLFRIKVDQSFWNKDEVIKYLSTITIPQFVSKSKSYITDKKIMKEEEKKIDPDIYNKLIVELPQLPIPPHLSVSIRSFEKDDDTNSHVDFITATANLRATNYSINPATRMEAKRIAGRIVPAIATTTVTVASLVSLELIKVIMNKHKEIPLDYFKCTTLNLALPLYAMSEPGHAKKIKLMGNAFYTIWDRWELHQPEMTLSQFCDHFTQRYNLTVAGIFHGSKRIYAKFLPADKKKMVKKMKEVLGNIKEEFIELIVCFDNESGQDVDAPTVKFYLK